MIAKEEAKKIYDSFYNVYIEDEDEHYAGTIERLAKNFTVFSIKRIIKALEDYDKNTEDYLRQDFPEYSSFQLQNMESDLRYWGQVLLEAEKL
jgi:hypothetical protein